MSGQSESYAQKQIRAYLDEASELESFEELEQHFITRIDQLIPNENPCWNNFAPSLDEFISVIARDEYNEQFTQRFESLLATLPEHPVLQAGGWNLFTAGPARLSEFCSERNWVGTNPLYEEVYRHVDAGHQLCYHFATLSDRALIFTLNRPLLDFSDTESQKLEVLGQGMAVVSRNLEKRLVLKKRVTVLTDRLAELAGIANPDDLTIAETLALGTIFQEKTIAEAAAKSGVTTHTFTERLGLIREKLHLKSTPQLKALLKSYGQENT